MHGGELRRRRRVMPPCIHIALAGQLLKRGGDCVDVGLREVLLFGARDSNEFLTQAARALTSGVAAFRGDGRDRQLDGNVSH